MLKIYLCTLSYELKASNKTTNLGTKQYYVIKDEQDTAEGVVEFSAYSADAATIYHRTCDIYEKKKGRHARYSTWNREWHVKEWLEPDAKLVVHHSYKEMSCSMKELMTLPADDVIAYLRQEGLNLIIPS